MKTQIIRIESHDDIVSLKDKMGWGKTPRILLVWPDHTRIITRRLDLVFLKRHSESLGAQLAFVTKESDVRHHAGFLNIPVYSSIRKAEKSHWNQSNRKKRRKDKRKPSHISTPDQRKKYTNKPDGRIYKVKQRSALWSTHPISRLIFFSLGVISVLSLGAILLPGASIELKPMSEFKTVTIPVNASVDPVSTSGTVPVYQIQISVEGRGFTPTTGSIKIPNKKAEGYVVFTNLTDQTISIPSETIVSTLGNEVTRFVTQKAIVVNPSSTSDKVPIIAISPGIGSNVPSNHIISIEGPLGLDLTVTNPLATSNGTDQVYPAPNENDYDVLMENLIIELYKSAKDELKSQIKSDDMVLWIDPKDNDIIEAVFFPDEAEPSDLLKLTLRVGFSAYIVHGNDLRFLGKGVSDVNTDPAFHNNPDSIKIYPITQPEEVEPGTFTWDLDITWETTAIIKETEAINQILWKTPEQAAQSLIKNFPVEDDVSISTTPSWWPRMPILPSRVTLIYDQ